MNSKNYGAWLCLLLLICSPRVQVATGVSAAGVGDIAQPKVAEREFQDFQLITAEELKTKVERNERVTILDVRSTNTYVESANKIKGAIHVKLRRLRSRLGVPPLKNVPRDQEIVTYCACPSDEASIAAAEVLSAAGFKRVRVLKGGWRVWLKTNGPVEPRPGDD